MTARTRRRLIWLANRLPEIVLIGLGLALGAIGIAEALR